MTRDRHSKLPVIARRLSAVAIIAGAWMAVSPILALVQLHDARAVIAPLPTVEPSVCVEYINLSISSAYTFMVVGILTIGFAVLVFRALAPEGRKNVRKEDPNKASGAYG